jgi:hypothetical protein
MKRDGSKLTTMTRMHTQASARSIVNSSFMYFHCDTTLGRRRTLN